MRKIDKSHIGASIDLMLLSLLSEKDRYGYEIIRELELRSDETFKLKEGTMYPILHRLENDGYIKSYYGESTAGKKRRYYAITPFGKQQLETEKLTWSQFTRSVENVLNLNGGSEANVTA